MKRTPLYAAIAVVVIVIAGAVVAVLVTRGSDAGADGATTQSAFARTLQQRLGAESCTDAGFALENGLDGSREFVYDCTFPSRRRCITVTNGITRDATADVKRLFANMPGDVHADCAGP
jgi:hypothetical protein